MNKIVREHYPASKLPDELRAGIAPGRNVTVTVEEEWLRPEKPMSLEEIFEASKPFQTRSAEEIDTFIRAERDAWDD
jgi:hypothetical protein